MLRTQERLAAPKRKCAMAITQVSSVFTSGLQITYSMCNCSTSHCDYRKVAFLFASSNGNVEWSWKTMPGPSFCNLDQQNPPKMRKLRKLLSHLAWSKQGTCDLFPPPPSHLQCQTCPKLVDMHKPKPTPNKFLQAIAMCFQ